MTVVLGVDGCPGGWVGALIKDPVCAEPGAGGFRAGEVTWRFWPDVADVLAVGVPTAMDMPVGLPETGRRSCDAEARALLGPARSSVFLVPSRTVVESSGYPEACALARARREPAPSKQLWGLVPRIRALDALLTPAEQNRVVECHPEVSFVLMADRPLAGKRTAAGVGGRLAALGLSASVLAAAPPQARPDDALDAMACAWSAVRRLNSHAQVLGDGGRDGRGLRMEIVA